MRLNPTVSRLDKLARSTNLSTCRPNRVSTSKQRVTLTLTYDPVGNRTVEQDSLGGLATSTYDAVNHLTSRQFTGNSATARFDIAYTARDEQSVITRYTDLAGTNKIGESDFTFDATGRLTNLQHKDGAGANLANYTYTFDTGNRVTSEVLNGTTTSYQYDSTNQLTNDSTATYTFDATGNRTMAGYQTGAGNQMTNDGVYTYTYDAEGNLTKKSKGSLAETWNFTYDNANRLTTVTKALTDGGAAVLTATYLYDALNNRIQKSVLDLLAVPPMITPAVTRFALDGWKVTQGAQGARPNFIGNENFDILAELDSNSALVTRRLYTDQVDQVEVRIAAAGTTAWYLPDRLGSTRNITDNTGSIIDTVTYNGFGYVSSESSPTNGDSKKYVGFVFDSETFLNNGRNGRYYDAATGRWYQRDWYVPMPDENAYRYVHNNPKNATDPSGFDDKYSGSDGSPRPSVISPIEKYGSDQLPMRGWHVNPFNRCYVLDHKAGLVESTKSLIKRGNLWPEGSDQQKLMLELTEVAGAEMERLARKVEKTSAILMRGRPRPGDDVATDDDVDRMIGLWWQLRQMHQTLNEVEGFEKTVQEADTSILKANCFPAETLVGTEHGLRPINTVEAGDRVWSFDFQAGVWRLCEVACRDDSVYHGPIVTIDLGVGEVTAFPFGLSRTASRVFPSGNVVELSFNDFSKTWRRIAF